MKIIHAFCRTPNSQQSEHFLDSQRRLFVHKSADSEAESSTVAEGSASQQLTMGSVRRSQGTSFTLQKTKQQKKKKRG